MFLFPDGGRRLLAVMRQSSMIAMSILLYHIYVRVLKYSGTVRLENVRLTMRIAATRIEAVRYA